MAITVRKAAVEVDKFEKGLNNIARAILKEEGNKLVKHIKRTKFKRGGATSPSHIVNRTGKLERSLKAVVRFAGSGLVMEVTMEGVGAQAPSVEEGSKAQIIRPRRKKVLSFTVNGVRVFATLVRHPGIKARRVLTRSFEERSTAIVKRLERDMVREWERRLAG